jgi:hypothetical protein
MLFFPENKKQCHNYQQPNRKDINKNLRDSPPQYQFIEGCKHWKVEKQ